MLYGTAFFVPERHKKSRSARHINMPVLIVSRGGPCPLVLPCDSVVVQKSAIQEWGGAAEKHRSQ